MQPVYIITGIGGHLGNTIAQKLTSGGQTVRGFARNGEDVSMLSDEAVTIVRGDVRDIGSLERLFDGLTAEDEVRFIHCAGIVSIASKYDQAVVDVNVTGTANVIALCKRHAVNKLVYISSVHALPVLPKGQVIREIDSFREADVEGLYARTKAAATQMVLDAAKEGLNATVVHPSGIIGPNDYGRGHVTQLIVSCINGSLTACVDGGYDFVDVRDVADGVIAAAERGGAGACYILNNRYIPVSELLNMVCLTGHARRIKTVLPIWFAKFTAPLAELYYKIRHEAPLYTSYSLAVLTDNADFDGGKARRELGYAPRDIRRTVEDTVRFLLEKRSGLFRKRRLCAARA